MLIMQFNLHVCIHERNRPLDFVLPNVFYNESCKMSQENKMRIRTYVHVSRQNNELGRGVAFLVG